MENTPWLFSRGFNGHGIFFMLFIHPQTLITTHLTPGTIFQLEQWYLYLEFWEIIKLSDATMLSTMMDQCTYELN